MFTGITAVSELVADMPRVEHWSKDSAALDGVEILQVSYELAGGSAAFERLLPPALHPTIPMLVQWVGWQVDDSPWGPFNLVQQRLTCRSGARPRAFLAGAIIDNANAGAALASCWGLGCLTGEVKLSRHYDRAGMTVVVDNTVALDVELKDPTVLRPDDLQFFSGFNAATTPAGVRLLQMDTHIDVQRAERYLPRLDDHEPTAWGPLSLHPLYAVTACGAAARIELSPVRIICKPDQPAFTGTEKQVANQTGKGEG